MRLYNIKVRVIEERKRNMRPNTGDFPKLK